jgi:GNAT superfamily N-acetyltransferase
VKAEAKLDLTVRPYTDEDEGAVIDLLEASLGGGPAGERSREFFRWKHIDNPFGRSLMLVAEADDRLVGLRAFMRWRFRAGDREIRAVRAVDTATHPDYQGRGIFSRLTLQATEMLAGEADLVFNTPNDKSLPGYLKMGWKAVGKIPVAVRVRRPIRFIRGLPGLKEPATSAPGPAVRTPIAATALSDEAALSPLLAAAARSGDGRLATERTLPYLRWRYGSAPLLDYRALVQGDRGEPTGVAIFRVRPRGRLWETTIAEVVVRPGDRRTVRLLLHEVAAQADVDHMTCSFPSGSAQAAGARRHLFVPSPGGLTFVVNVLEADQIPDPVVRASWALTLGDLEVF